MLPTATIDDLRAFAAKIREREPDIIIGGDYMRRWYVVPRNEYSNVYLHEILRSDDDRALHDHPWDSTSIILEGGYIEHTPDGVVERRAGDVIRRQAEDAHRLEVIPGLTAVTLFFTGPKSREWGFHCPNGWVPWEQFCAPDSTLIGRGCD